MPRAPVDRPGVRRRHRAGAAADARQDLAGAARWTDVVRGAALAIRGDALPLAPHRALHAARLPGDLGGDRGGRDYGCAPPRVSRRGCAVPPGEHIDRARQRAAAQLRGEGGMSLNGNDDAVRTVDGALKLVTTGGSLD